MMRIIAVVFAFLCAVDVSHALIHPKILETPKGFKIWYVYDNNTPVISLQFQFTGGARCDPAGKEGLASITAQMLGSGTAEKDSKALDEFKQDYAIQLGFGADADQLSGNLTTLVQHKEKAFDLLKESLLKPCLKEDVYKNVINLAEISLSNMSHDPEYLARRKLEMTIFKDHPYENPVEGFPTTIKKISLTDVKGFIQDNLTKDRLLISVAGNLDEASAMAMVDQVFGGLPDKSRKPLTKRFQPHIVGKSEVIDLNIPQSIIYFVLPGVMYDDPDYMKMALLMHIMGEGFTSRLMQEIRVKRGLAYEAFATASWRKDAGYIFGMVGSPKAKGNQSITLIRQEWERLKKDGITAEELESAKTYMLNSYQLRFKNSNVISGILLGYQSSGRPIDYFQNRDKIISDINLKGMNDFIQKIIEPEKLSFVIVGRPDGDDLEQKPEEKIAKK